MIRSVFVCVLLLVTVFTTAAPVVAEDEASFLGERVKVEATILSIPAELVFSLMDPATAKGEQAMPASVVESREDVRKVAAVSSEVRGEKPWGRFKENGVEFDFEMVIEKKGLSADMLGILKGDGFSLQFDGGLEPGVPTLVGIATRYQDGEAQFLAFYINAGAKGGAL